MMQGRYHHEAIIIVDRRSGLDVACEGADIQKSTSHHVRAQNHTNAVDFFRKNESDE